MRVLDLFSGIGGFSLGLEWAGMDTVAFCEIDPFCRNVLAKHWPGVRIYDDVRSLTADAIRRDGIAIDVICGGFPCQDISAAGKRVGIEGERSGLWSEFARLIRELRPQYVIVENVSALLIRGLERVLRDLASCGYDAEWDCIPAESVGAPHERDRLWLVAYPHAQHGKAWMGVLAHYQAEIRTQKNRNRASIWLAPPSIPARVGDGFSTWVDRRERTEALGNAVVPQIPELIGRAIMACAARPPHI